MNLGVKSRKTGISVRDDIPMDEFNMENLDDFFQDNVSVASPHNKRTPLDLPSQTPRFSGRNRNTSSRRQSSLFQFNSNDLSSPHIMSPSINRTPLANDNNNSNIRTHNLLESIREEGNELNESGQTRKRPRPNRPSLLSNYKTSYGFDVTPTPTMGSTITTNQTPLRSPPIVDTIDEVPPQQEQEEVVGTLFSNHNPYIDDEEETENGVNVPELTTNDATVDNTSLVTSDDARLENELSQSSDNDYYSDSSEIDFVNGNEEDPNDLDLEDGYDDRTYVPSSPSVRTRVTTRANEIEEQDVRKSNRIKIPTLDYWRNEKIIYKRKNESPNLDIVKIVTYDDKPLLEESTANDNQLDVSMNSDSDSSIDSGITSTRTKRQKENSNIKLKKDHVKETVTGSWLRDGEFKANIYIKRNKTATPQQQTKKETVAFAPGIFQMEKTKQNENERYSLAITFDKHKDLFASGMLKIPNNGKRTMTNSDNAFITFYLIRGILEVTLNSDKFIVTSGSTFQVPAFNRYAFRNKGSNEVQLFFVQVIVPETINEGLSFDRRSSSGKGNLSDSRLTTTSSSSSSSPPSSPRLLPPMAPSSSSSSVAHSSSVTHSSSSRP